MALELTKKFERYHRGTLSELAAEFADQRPKGEATVVIEGLTREARKEARKVEKEARQKRYDAKKP